MNESKTQVLYLSYDGLTDPLGRSQILPYLCGLSDEGYVITIVSFEKPERFEQEKHEVATLCNQHNLAWEPLPYHKSPPVISTLYDLLLLRKWARRLHGQKRFSIVHCRSYITSLVGIMMKRRLGTKFIFDMRGFWADERVEGGLWNLRNPVYKVVYNFFKKKEKQFIKEADYVIVLTEEARNEILGWNLNHAIQVIPCCVDVDLFDPVKIDPKERELLRNELGIREGEFILLYLGSLGTWYLVEEMLAFFSELKKIKSDARFLMVTPDHPDVSNTENGQDIIVRKSTREKVPLFISLADAGVILIKPSYSKMASSATKMAEVLAMGVPLVTNLGWGDIARFQNALPGLITVSKSEDYPKAISLLLQTKNPRDIRKGADARFSLIEGVARYNAIYQDLI